MSDKLATAYARVVVMRFEGLNGGIQSEIKNLDLSSAIQPVKKKISKSFGDSFKESLKLGIEVLKSSTKDAAALLGKGIKTAGGTLKNVTTKAAGLFDKGLKGIGGTVALKGEKKLVSAAGKAIKGLGKNSDKDQDIGEEQNFAGDKKSEKLSKKDKASPEKEDSSSSGKVKNLFSNFKQIGAKAFESVKAIAGKVFSGIAAVGKLAFGKVASAAAESTEGFQESKENVTKALTDIGVKFASPVFGGLKKVFEALLPVIGLVGQALDPLAASFASLVDGVFSRVVGGITNFAGALASGESVAGAFRSALAAMFSGSAFQFISNALSNPLMSFPQIIGASLGGVKEGVSGFVSFIEQKFPALAGPIEGFKNAFQGIWGTLSPILTGLFEGVKEFAKNFMGAFSADGLDLSSLLEVGLTLFSLTSPLGIVKQLFTLFGDDLARVGVAIGETLVPLLGSLGAMLGGTIAAILPAIQSCIETLLPVVGEVISTIANLVVEILPIVASLVEQLVPVIVQIAEIIGQLMVALAPLIAQLIETLMPVIVQIIEAVMQFVTAVAPIVIAIIQVIIGIIEALMPVIIAIAEVVMNVISIVVTAIGTVIAIIFEVATTVVNVIATVFGVIAQVPEFFMGMVNGIGGACAGIFDVISGGFQAALDFITSLPEKALKWGSDIIDGIVSGITGAIGAVADAVGSVADTIFGFLHFSEPDVGPLSNFHTYMPDMMQGLAGGMLSNLNMVDRAASKVAKTISSAVFPEGTLNPFEGFSTAIVGSSLDLILGQKKAVPAAAFAGVDGGAVSTYNFGDLHFDMKDFEDVKTADRLINMLIKEGRVR